MKLMPAVSPTRRRARAREHDHGHDAMHADGLSSGRTRWRSQPADHAGNMSWKLVDRDTGAENEAIDWTFRVGDRVKIRLVNEMARDHPMHHPFHIHGAGRFLVLARDGEPEEPGVEGHGAVRTGETVDILLDVTNPGLWMAHCHIAEHHQSGMMFSFRVTRRG